MLCPVRELHDSNSRVHSEAEAIVLAALSEQLCVRLQQGVKLKVFDKTPVEPDGVSEDESVFVEVSAHVGPPRGGQRHKPSTDALKLMALRESRPKARLILAFVDHAAANGVSGWRAAALEHFGIEKLVVELSEEQRDALLASQARNKQAISAPAPEQT